MDIKEEALKKHYEWQGKIEVVSRAPINTREDLSLAYTPGVAQACLDESIKYAKERKQFGKPIADFQGISFMIADMATEIAAARELVYNAANLKDANMDATTACSMAKYFAAEVANRCAYKAVQIHGGYGYMKDYAIERMYRDARIIPLYEGTSEVQKMVISRAVIK